HGFGDTDGHRAVLVIAENDRFVFWRAEGDVKIKNALVVGASIDGQCSLVAALDGPVFGQPVIGGADDAGILAGFYFQKLAVSDAGAVGADELGAFLHVVPKIDAIDFAVGVPK